MYFGPFVGGSVSLDLDCAALRIELRPIIIGDRQLYHCMIGDAGESMVKAISRDVPRYQERNMVRLKENKRNKNARGYFNIKGLF